MAYLIDPASLPGGGDTGNEWYTPHPFVDAARRVMGGEIDLDPASCAYANQVVRAARFFDESADGLAQPWVADRLWLNPPYGKTNGASNQGIWARRLIHEYQAGRAREAVMLVTVATDMKWFAVVWDYAICFVAAKIHFYGPGGEERQHPQGAACVYFGNQDARFCAEFSAFGPTIPSGVVCRRSVALRPRGLWEEML